MRDIKFRAWDEKNKVMHTDVEFLKSGDESNDWLLFSSNEQRYKVEGYRIVFDNPYIRTQIHLMQFTGLKDKNGKEIYEGDFISEKGSSPYEVIWQSHSVQWIMQSVMEGRGYRQMAFDYAQMNYKVIGNIYENPELLSPAPQI